jgi:hypothetical protein
MLTKTQIALAAVISLGVVSAASAQGGAAAHRARENYAQGHIAICAQAGSNVVPRASMRTQPASAVRPYTSFEQSWFDYQSHDDR